MIDYEKLNQDYETDNIYALQLEIGDKCFQGCIYCYMNAVSDEKNTLSDDLIKHIILDSKKLGITAIEWLGGEPLLRKSIFSHMSLAHDLGFKNNVWTGGLPLADDFILENTAKYANPGLISLHVSTVDPTVYENLHPNRTEKDLDLILSAVETLLDLGYSPSNILNSVTFTGLQTSDDMIKTMDYFQDKYNIKTSLNVYHTYLRPGTPEDELRRFIPTRKEVAKVYKHYSKHYGQEQLPMNCVNKQYCSATVAVLCDGSVTPCATIREKGAPNIHTDGSFYDVVLNRKDHLIIKKLKDKNNLHEDCASCVLSDSCWGCRSRAYAAGRGIYGKDPRCFRKKEVEVVN
jgi:radical SAM protein with 4Fe4S-binding SPASM domain